MNNNYDRDFYICKDEYVLVSSGNGNILNKDYQPFVEQKNKEAKKDAESALLSASDRDKKSSLMPKDSLLGNVLQLAGCNRFPQPLLQEA